MRPVKDDLPVPYIKGKELEKPLSAASYVFLLLLRRDIIATKPNKIPKNPTSIAVNQPSTQGKLSLQRSNIYCQNPHISVLARIFTNIVSPPWHFSSALGYRSQLSQRFDGDA